MKYKEILLRSKSIDKIKTEIMYEVASAHIAGIELVRFTISKSESEAHYKKIFSAMTRVLKAMKAEGAIQFFATPALLEYSSTEAEFLLNKYPEQFEPMPEESESESFIYVRT